MSGREDGGLKYIILGALRGVIDFPTFPVRVDHVEQNFNANDVIESFTIVTFSGLRYRVVVEKEEQP
jgi:hypothetical protein